MKLGGLGCPPPLEVRGKEVRQGERFLCVTCRDFASNFDHLVKLCWSMCLTSTFILSSFEKNMSRREGSNFVSN